MSGIQGKTAYSSTPFNSARPSIFRLLVTGTADGTVGPWELLFPATAVAVQPADLAAKKQDDALADRNGQDHADSNAKPHASSAAKFGR